MHDGDGRTGASNIGDYEASYLKEVLGLEEGMKEEDVDDKLIAEAKELGIALEIEKTSEDRKAPTAEAAPGRSSVESKRSQATSVLSTASSVRPRSQHGRRTSRASLSLRDYDDFLARGRPEGRASMSFSPSSTPSASASVFSLPLSSPESSPKKHYRLLRGLSMLKLSRENSVASMRGTGCPHCPRDPLSQRRAVHKLPCGHRLCTQALRDTIQSAISDGTGAIPSCCGIPIPGCLVEHVMTQEEQNALLDRLEQWSRPGSSPPSTMSEVREAPLERRPAALTSASRTVSNESKVDSVAPESKRTETTLDTSRPEVQQLHRAQASQHDHLRNWAQTQRAALTSKHDLLRREMRAGHEAAAENLEEHHATAMSEAEDKQVNAEADLRAQHDQEARDSATALKHMEAYCAGTYVSTGTPHHRPVTEQDLVELESARKTRDGLPAKHASAINVLRGEQARRLRLRGQRQEREMVDLRRGQRREELEGERSWAEEGRGFEEWVEGRRGRLGWRWEVERRILRRRLEVGSDRAGDEGGDGALHATNGARRSIQDYEPSV